MHKEPVQKSEFANAVRAYTIQDFTKWREEIKACDVKT